MKATDRLLQRWRIRRALKWMPADATVLDIGCADGALFDLGRRHIRSGLGIEPEPAGEWRGAGSSRRITGGFPDAVPPGETFDAITMLAVVEHIQEPELAQWGRSCHQFLRPGGRVIITVPSPAVDKILHVGMALRLLDGMDAHHHHGLDPRRVPAIFVAAGLEVEAERSFQFGLNNLFVLRKPVAA